LAWRLMPVAGSSSTSSSAAGLDSCSSGGTAGSPRGGPFAWYHLLGGRWVRWMPLPAATTRSGVLEVYERRPRGLSTLTELRGLDPKGFGLWRWVLDRWIPRALGVGPPGRWVLDRQGVGCAAGSPRGRWVLDHQGVGCWTTRALGALGRRRRGLRTVYFARRLCTSF